MCFNNPRILAEVNNYPILLHLQHKKVKTINSINYQENSIIQIKTILNNFIDYMGIVCLYKLYKTIIKLNLTNSKKHPILQ